MLDNVNTIIAKIMSLIIPFAIFSNFSSIVVNFAANLRNISNKQVNRRFFVGGSLLVLLCVFATTPIFG